jgi:hypothetical protein
MSLLLLILRGIGMNPFALVADFEKESHKNYAKMKARRNMTCCLTNCKSAISQWKTAIYTPGIL